jgi:serine/threonine protein kinase
LLNYYQNFKDRFDVSDRSLGRGSYGAVYLAKEEATSRQLACKIVDLDVAAHKLTEVSASGVAGEEWHERIRRVARGKELVMREVRILSKLSHVCAESCQCPITTDTSQPHIVNLKKAFISSGAL